MVYWKAKHGILQAEKACFAIKSDCLTLKKVDS